MSKATKLVTIIVTESEMLEWPTFKKMAEQGHQILTLETFSTTLFQSESKPPFALVMGPRAHLLLPGMEKMIPVALKQARSELYPPKPKKETQP